MSDCAFLNNSGNFTAFTYNGRTIRFRTPSSLERYTDILEWDKGYRHGKIQGCSRRRRVY